MSSGSLLSVRRARQLEVVHRAITMGLWKAAEQLSSFVGQAITIEAPRLGLCAVEDLVACTLGSAFCEEPTRDADALMTGIYLCVSGDVEGHFVLLLAPDDARALVMPLIADLAPPEERQDEMILSALCEVGNITASALFNALADAAQLRIEPSCPAVVTDMAGAILELPLLDIAQLADDALYIETSITMASFATTGALALIPRPEGLEPLIRGLTGGTAKGVRR